MKNQSPENGAPIVPDHLQDAWNAATQELREASEELQRANERYHKAVLARIALTKAANNES